MTLEYINEIFIGIVDNQLNGLIGLIEEMNIELNETTIVIKNIGLQFLLIINKLVFVW